ncbi:MAG TPA: zf-HC2 domain-containing protein [Bryobacteraceae bacterium]|jgi:hypothetical protein|nr:zf-HC2 domain-containing protein [Bryobacteraceae bacterium]
MTCWNVKRRSTDFVDGRLRKREHSRIEAHLRECDKCAFMVDQLRGVRLSLVGLRSAQPQPPNSLRSKLLVLASKERQLVLETHGSRWARLWNRWKFELHELMQPFTIPATGGVVSSTLLFMALAFTIGTTTQQTAYEVPVIYGDQLNANLIPVELRLQSAVELTLSLDGRGHITDYSVLDGVHRFVGDAGRLEHNNNITLPTFPAVLALPQPTIGDVRISLTPIVYRQ